MVDAVAVEQAEPQTRLHLRLAHRRESKRLARVVARDGDAVDADGDDGHRRRHRDLELADDHRTGRRAEPSGP